jgi:hypothetical protein
VPPADDSDDIKRSSMGVAGAAESDAKQIHALKQEMHDLVQRFADQTMRKLTNLTSALGAELSRSRRPTRGVRAAADELAKAEVIVRDIGDNPRGEPKVIMQKFVNLDAVLKRAAALAGLDYSRL